MIVVDTQIRIAHPIEAVFAYVADVRRLPEWNSAVVDVRPDSTPSRFVMHRRLPSGPATNLLAVAVCEPPTRFEIETISGPTPFHYAFRFHGDATATRLQLRATVELGSLAGILAPLARRGVERGINANLETLAAGLAGPPGIPFPGRDGSEALGRI